MKIGGAQGEIWQRGELQVEARGVRGRPLRAQIQIAAILVRAAQTDASKVLLGLSSFLLLLSIGAFGLITYSRPFRLRHEQKIDRELNRDLPKIP